ncbi:MAG: class I SAM-dependent methyltransferase, partial [Deltaproteobacteria bacterium]|nr:class I SAM-dependent methyltransferase [Deltaproteobacteria bacterium]
MRKRYIADEYGEGPAFWDRNWQSSFVNWGKRPPVNEVLVKIMLRYIKPNMIILEGGCGDGRYVRYFKDMGFNIIGVDYAEETVRYLNKRFPDLDIRFGDIRKLDFPDGYFDAYYSGGVIEHFEEGLESQLLEANRVLKKDGLFFVTVPHMNFLRILSSKLRKGPQYRIDLDGRKSWYF